MSLPWVAIQRNPISGTGNRASLIMDLIRHLKQKGIRPRLFSNRERMQKLLRHQFTDAPPLCVVAAGGDGTVQDLINRYPDQRIAILPLGTENLMARYLGIPRSGVCVAEMIKEGATREVDLCQMQQKRFILMASVGFDAAVVADLTEFRKGNISHLSYLKPLWRTICSYPYERLLISTDQSTEEFTAYHAIIVNIPAYGLNLKFSPSANDQDGLLDLILFKKKGLFSTLKYLYQIVRGSHLNSPDVLRIQANRIQIRSAKPVPVQTDGDASGLTPLEITVLPRAGRFIVPC
ncbi:Diacylglycerol kinase [Gimesia maris]|uniref:diacylglycerol/lipid kinase family protein n=1 Tax=Gimesia maris TaxID=122 RepID=UPI00118D2D1A|nr:diacylglycerol kinase family protein [Gimesia maris]QDU16999.1 Diacylglycerol kinase [Gimesia maris]